MDLVMGFSSTARVQSERRKKHPPTKLNIEFAPENLMLGKNELTFRIWDLPIFFREKL